MLNQTEPALRTKALIKCWGSLTPAIAQQSAQVSSLKAEARGDVAEALGNLLTFAAAQFNVGKNLNDVQIALLASEMLRIYWHWRFDEFSLMLREAVAGKYGTTYDRIDAATVHEWCTKYEANRNAAQAHLAEHEARAYRQAEQQPLRSELAEQPGYAELRAKMEVLSDEQLRAGGKHYEALATRTEEEELKLGVAREVWNERRKAHYLSQMAERVQNTPKPAPTLRQQMANQMQATRDRINAKLLGESSPVWGIAQHWLDIIDVDSEPVAPEAPNAKAA